MKRWQVSGAMIAPAMALIALAIGVFGAVPPASAQTTVYYFNYDGSSNGGAIADETGNGHDLGTFSPASFTFAPLSGGVPVVAGARAFDVGSTLNGVLPQGGLTDGNPISNAQVAAAGGYTYETWIKRTSLSTATEIVWSPEGTHTIEIFQYDSDNDFDIDTDDSHAIQLAFRFQQAFTADADIALPIGEWHHIMAVMDMAEDTAAPNDARYSLLIDGVLATPLGGGANPLGPHNLVTGLDLDSSGNPRHGIGWNEFGGPNGGLRGQLAYTRLSLGVVDYADSFAFEANIPIPEPASLALAGLAGLAIVAVRRRVR